MSILKAPVRAGPGQSNDTLGLEMQGYPSRCAGAELDAGNTTRILIDSWAWASSPAMAVEDLPAAMEELQGKDGGRRLLDPGEPHLLPRLHRGPDGNHVWLHQRKDGTFG